MPCVYHGTGEARGQRVGQAAAGPAAVSSFAAAGDWRAG